MNPGGSQVHWCIAPERTGRDPPADTRAALQQYHTVAPGDQGVSRRKTRNAGPDNDHTPADDSGFCFRIFVGHCQQWDSG